MSEIKCRVCGATPDVSRDILPSTNNEYVHRFKDQCISFLGGRIHTLEWTLRKILVSARDSYDYPLKEMIEEVLK